VEIVNSSLRGLSEGRGGVKDWRGIRGADLPSCLCRENQRKEGLPLSREVHFLRNFHFYFSFIIRTQQLPGYTCNCCIAFV